MLKMDYFYENEAEQFTFYRIPKLLITFPEFKKVSDSAKLLYGLMLDRMGLSLKNGWFDNENRAYIFFTTAEVMEQMNCGTEKATKILAELDCKKGIGLIERRKQGQGKPTMIYLKKFYADVEHGLEGFSDTENQDYGMLKFKNLDNQNTRISKNENSDFRLATSNYNNINKNKTNDNEFNDIQSYPITNNYCISREFTDANEWIFERKTYEQIIKNNVDYSIIVEQFEKKWLDEIIELMVDVVCSKEPYIRINKQEYPHEVVKERFLKIESSHIEYIYFALQENCSNVRNIRAFLITTIYRSFETSENWFSAKVKYDIANKK